MVRVCRDSSPGERELAVFAKPWRFHFPDPRLVWITSSEAVYERTVQLGFGPIRFPVDRSRQPDGDDTIDRPRSVARRTGKHRPIDPVVGTRGVPKRDTAPGVRCDDVKAIEIDLIDEPQACSRVRIERSNGSRRSLFP